jgi:hypothetical protein
VVSWLLDGNSSLTPYLRSEKSEMASLFDAIELADLRPWIPVIEGHCRDLWQREYSNLTSKEDRGDSGQVTSAIEAGGATA